MTTILNTLKTFGYKLLGKQRPIQVGDLIKFRKDTSGVKYLVTEINGHIAILKLKYGSAGGSCMARTTYADLKFHKDELQIIE